MHFTRGQLHKALLPVGKRFAIACDQTAPAPSAGDAVLNKNPPRVSLGGPDSYIQFGRSVLVGCTLQNQLKRSL